MKHPFKNLLVTAALGLWAGAANAHHAAGQVVCSDVSPARPLSGIAVTIQGALGGVFTDVTDAEGVYAVELPVLTDTYTITIALPSGYTMVSPASGQQVGTIFANAVGGPDSIDGANFSLAGCLNPPLLGQIGDTVYCDANANGVQDSTEAGIPGVKVNLVCKDASGATVASAQATTDANGKYLFINVPAGRCEVSVDTASVTGDCNKAVCDTLVLINLGAGEINLNADFCFTEPPQGPGTGTPGYWKNHPTAWPVNSITIGGRSYSKSVAITWIGAAERGDKTKTVFRHLVCAKLNVLVGNVSTCIDADILKADAWMALHPVGSNVSGASAAWAEISATATKLDDYNNGRLCAPHRD